jgi:alpha-beta hydrolase superfamily lysophospholipase
MLSAEGTIQLRAAGLRSSDTVPARVLGSLIRSGQAHSPRPAEAAGQVRFDFSDDNTADHLPRCELTGTTADLHLVVHGEGNGVVARLLSRQPRFLLQKVTTLSVPVTILTLSTVAQLEVSGKLPSRTEAAEGIRQWLRQDLDAAWEKLRRERAHRQASLPLGDTPEDLPLSP